MIGQSQKSVISCLIKLDMIKKSELENYAMSEILESLPEKIQNDYQNLWNEFLLRDTQESKLVHELDKLEMALQAKIYEKDIMVVTGRADISVILNSSIDEINNVVIDLKNVKEIVNTETLIEVEVDLGW